MIANLSHISGTANRTNPGSGELAARSPWRMLVMLLDCVGSEGVEYAVLGETEHLPTDLDSDVDLVIPKGQFPSFQQAIRRFAEANDARLIQAIQHEQTAWFYILAWPDKNGMPQYLQLDVCSDYFRSGKKLLDSDFLLSSKSSVSVDGEPLNVPGPVAGFVYYLVKKSEKKAINKSQQSLLSDQWAQMTPSQKDEVSTHFDGLKSSSIEEILAGHISSDNLAQFRSAFRKPATSPGNRIRELFRLVKRVLKPNGLFVVMMGPDGSGKTTINTLARSYTKTAFWGEQYFHFRPFTGSADDDKNVVTDPHGEPPRGFVSSVAKLFYYLFDYVAGYFLKIRPVIARSGLVIFDRYYADMQVDTVRYRYGGPHWLLKLLGSFVPQPDLYLFLDVDAETILARKQEVTPEECARQVDAYRSCAGDLKNANLVDASRPPEVVASDAAWTILNSLADKTARRLNQ